jgi:hypothetical protein
MVRVYVLLIQKGLRTIEQVQPAIREAVRAELAQQ